MHFCVTILLSVAFKSSSAGLPPPININQLDSNSAGFPDPIDIIQLDFVAGREVNVPKMTEEDIPLECGAKKKLDCNSWENN